MDTNANALDSNIPPIVFFILFFTHALCEGLLEECMYVCVRVQEYKGVNPTLERD